MKSGARPCNSPLFCDRGFFICLFAGERSTFLGGRIGAINLPVQPEPEKGLSKNHKTARQTRLRRKTALISTPHSANSRKTAPLNRPVQRAAVIYRPRVETRPRLNGRFVRSAYGSPRFSAESASRKRAIPRHALHISRIQPRRKSHTARLLVSMA